jgi:hypothetical protein
VLGRIVEIIATALIVILVGVFGRLMLAGLARHASISAAVIALLIVAAIVVLRRDWRGSATTVRLAITRDVAYLTSLCLLLWAVVAPGRTSAGSALAMIEVALIFDAFTRYAGGRQAP